MNLIGKIAGIGFLMFIGCVAMFGAFMSSAVSTPRQAPDFKEMAARSDIPKARPTRNTVSLDQNEAGLIMARNQAKRTLPTFLKKLEAGEPGTYSVKFPLTSNGKTEHIWLQVDDVRGTMFQGRLANVPLGSGYRMGQNMVIANYQIEDWMIQTPAGIYGAYTARHAATKMSPSERAAIERRLLD